MSIKARARAAWESTGRTVLADDTSHYFVRVLRLKSGDRVELFDGAGRIAEGTLQVSGAKASFDLAEERRLSLPQPRLTVAVAPPKGDRIEWLVEKLTEVGAANIQWLTTSRSVVVPKSKGAKADRLQRIADGAARQCGRVDVPALLPTVSFDEAIAKAAGPRYIAHPLGGDIEVYSEPPTSLSLFVGPEGGFTDDELNRAQLSGCERLTVGPHVLRIETAAVVCAALLMSGAAKV